MSEMHAFITSLCRMKRANYSKHTLGKQDCIDALSFTGVLRDRVFCKELCWFLRCRAGKKKEKKKDFVQPLVAFPSCNISYFGCTHCSLCTDCSFNYFLPIRPKKRGRSVSKMPFLENEQCETQDFFIVFLAHFCLFVCLFVFFFFFFFCRFAAKFFRIFSWQLEKN